MKNRALLSALAVTLVLAACEGNPLRIFGVDSTSTPPPTPTKVCDKNATCQINVTVTGCAAGGSQISLDHEVVGMKKGDSNIQIHWQLIGNQYEFPSQAITVASGQFSTAPGGNKNNYFLSDRNSPSSGSHKYSVTVVKANGGGACATKDPIIINDY